jgi:hypothetical protein
VKHYETNSVHPYSLRVSFLVLSKSRAWQEVPWFGSSQCDKQNKQTTFIERCMWPLFQWKITWLSKWGNKCRTTLGFKFKTWSKFNVEMFKLLFPLSFQRSFSTLAFEEVPFGSPFRELLFFKGVLWGWQAPWKNWCSITPQPSIISVSCLKKKAVKITDMSTVCDSAYVTNYNISYREMRFLSSSRQLSVPN